MVTYTNIYQRLHRSNGLEGNPSSILKTIIRTPAHLTIFYPILFYSIPFMTTNHFGYPVAALIVKVGYFLHKAHKLRNVLDTITCFPSSPTHFERMTPCHTFTSFYKN